jgi:hypothetical protein
MPELVLEYVKVLIWPITITILLFAYRNAIISVLPKSRIKVSLFGLEVETTLPELETITLATLGGHLNNKQLHLLTRMANEGPIAYEEGGIPKDDRKWIRPLMNAGLIMTTPVGAHLGEADGLALTPLGSLLVRPMMKTHSPGIRTGALTKL